MTTYWIDKASDNNESSNAAAIRKALESSSAIVESSVLECSLDTDTDETIELLECSLDTDNDETILALMPKDAFKSTKSSFSSFRLSFSGKKKEVYEPSSPLPTAPSTPVPTPATR